MAKIVLRFRAADRRIFDALKSGVKRVETRAATTKYAGVVPGDELVLVCGRDNFRKPINLVRYYATIEEMLREIPYQEIMPWARSVQEVNQTYAGFPGYPAKIKQFGIVALS